MNFTVSFIIKSFNLVINHPFEYFTGVRILKLTLPDGGNKISPTNVSLYRGRERNKKNRNGWSNAQELYNNKNE